MAVESVSPNQIDETPMHLFDIRRSRSVIELWKGVEHTSAQRLHTPNHITYHGISKSSDSKHDKKDGHSSEARELDTNQSLGLHWLDACRPPQLPPKVFSESQPPVASDVKSTPVAKSEQSASPTIMSLSAITDEGKRQVSSKHP